MQKYMACPHKWGQEEILGVEQPPSDATDLGSEFHRELEHWLGKRKPPSQITLAGRMAREAMKNLPMPIVNVEREVNFEYGGVQYQGHIDADWLEGDVIRYHDHKSTSSLGWAKTEDDLREDPQHIIYGKALLLLTPSARSVHASWQYTETKAPHHQLLVQIRRRPQEVERDMQALHETVGLPMWRILEHRERVQFSPHELQKLADSLPKNFSHCSAYGWRTPEGEKRRGCYLMDQCHRGLDPRHRLKAIMTQQSLRDRLLNRKRELAANNSTPEPEPETLPVSDNPERYAEIAAGVSPEFPVVTIETTSTNDEAPQPPPPEAPKRGGRRRRRPETTPAPVEVIVVDGPQPPIETKPATVEAAALHALSDALGSIVAALAPLSYRDRTRVLNAAWEIVE